MPKIWIAENLLEKNTERSSINDCSNAGRGNRVRDRIIQHEKSWIKNRIVHSTRPGKSPMLHPLIDDERTKLALREYLAGAGEKLNGQSVAFAISTYWQTWILPFKEQAELKNPPLPYTAETKAQLAQLADKREEVKETLSCRTGVK